MAGKKEETLQKPVLVMAKEWFEQKKVPFTGKRATLVAVYYSFPSNQNASGGEGTNVVSQKLLPWGQNAEPRVYVSPYALKRRIRDYWLKKGLKVYFKEDRIVMQSFENSGGNSKVEPSVDYIDCDLFGYMKAKKGSTENANARAGPITTWGAISLETLHSFLDFNTSVRHTGDSESGGSIFNRLISPEFYFTSFAINPDLISVELNLEMEELDEAKKAEILKSRKEKLNKFFEALPYAMQKDVGGPRDKPSCVLLAVKIGDTAYPNFDKKLFQSMEVVDDNGKRKIRIKDPNVLSDAIILSFDESFFEDGIKLETKGPESVVELLVGTSE